MSVSANTWGWGQLVLHNSQTFCWVDYSQLRMSNAAKEQLLLHKKSETEKVKKKIIFFHFFHLKKE